MQQNSQPFSSGLLLYKSGNVESLGQRKGLDVNYFSGHGVIIIGMLRISHEICLVIKEFEETQINEIEPLGSSGNTWSWERTALLGLILMSCLPDWRGVCLRWCVWEQQRIGLAQFLTVPTNAAALWEVIEAPSFPVSIAQELLSTSPLDYRWLLLLSPWNSKHHQPKPFKDLAVAPFISVGLPKAWGLFSVRNSPKCGDNLSGWQHKRTVIFLFAWSMWRLCFFLVCISLQFWVIASGPAESSCSLGSGI